MPLDLHLDLETRSVVDVREVGPSAYSLHESTQVTSLSAYHSGKMISWHLHQGRELDFGVLEIEPADRHDFLVHAHNAAFERACWNNILAIMFGFPILPIDRFRCSAARAAMLNLPASLEKLAGALDTKERKDKAGNKTMMKLTSPVYTLDSPDLFDSIGPQFNENPRLFEEQAKYCDQDVRVEMECSEIIGQLTPQELQVWIMDQEINERGLLIDRELCERVIDVVETTTSVRASRLVDITDGFVSKPTQNKRICQWLSANGELTDSLSMDVVEAKLKTKLKKDVREVLEIRRDTSKSSTAKYYRMLDRSEFDGRMRDNLRYHGAGTGRWAGSGAQIQNYPRGRGDVDGTISAELFLEQDTDSLQLMYGDPVQCAKDTLRAAIVAPPGRSLLVWDYGQIEARVLPWLAGETWKVDAFRAIDMDPINNPDIYKLSYAKTFLIDPALVTKAQRQMGKCLELALGYGGGPGAFISFAAIFFLDIADYYDELCEAFPSTAEQADASFLERGRGAERQWVAAEIVKLCWRAKHPQTVALWRGLEDAAIRCVETGYPTSYRSVRFRIVGDFLKMILPNGKPLSYFKPHLEKSKWGNQSLYYWKTKDGRLVREATYGGKLSENITQAVSRELLAEAMLRMRSEGFEMVGTVHDEVIAECDDCDAERLLQRGDELMKMKAGLDPWDDGLPIAVDGFITKRYKK